MCVCEWVFVSIFGRDTRIRILCIRLEMLSVRILYRLHEYLNEPEEHKACIVLGLRVTPSYAVSMKTYESRQFFFLFVLFLFYSLNLIAGLFPLKY